jgi:conjugal transfer pilus assembly protein TraW
VTTDYDVVDHLGNVIYTAGTTVNPLEYTSLSTPLVFFDGDDTKQATWVRAFLGDTPDRYMPLLTNGSAIELMQAWNIRLYFDQHGRYSEQLGITALPAIVRQEGLLLRVDEIALEKS